MPHCLRRLTQALGLISTLLLAVAPAAHAAATGPALVYATYAGGKGTAEDATGNGVAVDGHGDVYVLETTTSHQTYSAILLAKFSPSGTRLYTKEVSGPCGGTGGALAVDHAGNVDVTGLVLSKDQNGVCVLKQALVAKLTPAGTPVYSLKVGQPDAFSTDAGDAIAVDRAGNAYVTGEANLDPRFPSTPGAYQTTPSTVSSAFVLKVDPAGKLVYSTFLGKDETTKGLAIAVDRQGAAYVGGTTTSADFPTSLNAYQAAPRRSPDNLLVLGTPFVAKLNAAGSAVIYATYLGADGQDFLRALALDPAGHIYVAGQAIDLHFPVTASAYSRAPNPGLTVATCSLTTSCARISDAFLAELSPDPRLSGRRTLLYATYYGGAQNESAQAVTVDGAGRVYLTGATTSLFHFPLVTATQPRPGAGANYMNTEPDAFVAAFDPTRAGTAGLLFSTYLGGSAGDEGDGIAVDGTGALYVTGATASADFPTRGGTAGTLRGTSDAFLAKIAWPR